MRYVLPNSLTYTPQSDPSYFRFAPLPAIVECPRYPTLNFVSSRAEYWNCNPFCGAGLPYFSLYKFGDIIPLQVNLPDVRNINNTGTSRPQIGWRQTEDPLNNFWYVRAEIYNLEDCTTPIFSLVDDFCTDWWVGFSDKVGSVQTLFIDTSTIAVPEGFIVKITTVKDDLTDNITLWSEPFLRTDRKANCNETIILEGQYLSTDCENRDYRNPENDYTVTGAPLYAIKEPFVATGQTLTPFVAKWRFEANVTEQGNNGSIELNDNDIAIRQKIVRNYNLDFLSPIPPYAYNVATAILRAGTVTIDGTIYTTIGDINKDTESGKMFIPSVPLELACDLKNLRC